MTELQIRPIRPDERRAFVRFVPFHLQRVFRLEPYAQEAPGHHLDAPVRRQGVAHGAWLGGAAVGLALVSEPQQVCARRDPLFVPTLLWISVDKGRRGQGIAQALCAAACKHASSGGHHHAHTIYATDATHSTALQRVLEATGWGPAEPMGREFVFEVARLAQAPWLRRLPSVVRYKLSPWHALSPTLKEEARRSHETQPWIDPHLVFWDCEPQDAEPSCSSGILFEDRLSGWLLTHRRTARTLHFTQLFVREDLASLGLALPAVARALSAMPEAGFECGVFEVSASNERMNAIADRHILPWVRSVTERAARYRVL